MAKQSGLHQIRGKVGEYSYYRQTGVAPGLLRGINSGLSSRVKTGDEYANTRLNNSEFGAACSVAGCLGKMITPKYRPMILPFSQSKMAKDILEIAKQKVELWGQRAVGADDSTELAQILTSTSKLSIGDYMRVTAVANSESAIGVTVNLSVEQVQTLIDLGIDGIVFKINGHLLRSGQYSPVTNHILRSNVRPDGDTYFRIGLVSGQPFTGEQVLAVGANPPVAPYTENVRICTVVAMPFRAVGGSDFTLQEFCMFTAFNYPSL